MAASSKVLRILNVLLTAEKVETTLYAEGLKSGVLNGIDPDDLTYFQAGVSEEFEHAVLLEALGASIPNREFFFPPQTLTDLGVFLGLVETLETGGVGAYSAAIFHFGGDLKRPELALLGAKILGIEAEHRVLARVVAKKNPPDNLCIEAVPTLSFEEIERMFRPFLSPGQFGGKSVGPFPFPDQATVASLADGNFCEFPLT